MINPQNQNQNHGRLLDQMQIQLSPTPNRSITHLIELLLRRLIAYENQPFLSRPIIEVQKM